ncbi:histidinol-phosphatase HisJ family protein [Lachnobacterium bovis]|uniref:Histidinol-phosphatase n=1 Tax=Lachnobacterium bovis TaxID=140626 RepID=A0A1H9TEL9_9FIRM|nr:histidinol-phosphatase HisJ family protein [Lachnobacterium bovis]SER95279.1 histidinol-phosphatase (PHP family) [Lachnobacterium bovis]
MLFDTHIHSSFSGDSETPMEQIIKKSIALKLDGICFTEHLDFDYPDEPSLFLLDADSYYQKFLSFQQKYASSIDLSFGIEIGLQPQIADKNENFINSYPFDFVIGSSHVVHGYDPYFPAFFENKTEDNAYLEYFESILENLNFYDNFDVYGHIDYVVRYGPNTNKYYSYAKYSDIIDEILKKLIFSGKGIELNTGGFKYGLGHPNPCEDIIKRYRELGGEIITIGSDAHKCEHIAYDFNKVANILHDAGFSYFTIFKNRKPIFKKI